MSNGITQAQMKEAITRSGYLMEQRVIPILERAGYYVKSNPVYPDPSTGKSREYDFSAIEVRKIFRGELDYLYVNLIGECVNNAQPLVLFKAKSPVTFLFCEDLKCAGIPQYLYCKKDSDEISFQEYFNLENFHHYCNGKFSTQYCSFRNKSKKDSEWMAWHDEEHHSMFNTLVEATKYELERWSLDWTPPTKDEEQPLDLALFYPVLILKNLYECSQSKGKLYLVKAKHIQFRRSSFSGRKQDTFNIDVIIESYLPKYLEILDKEHEGLKRRFQRKKKDVLNAIDYIVDKSKKEKKLRKIKRYSEVLKLSY